MNQQQYLEIGDNRLGDLSSGRRPLASSVTSEIVSEMSEEEYIEYERQKALNLAFLDEYEESGDENETAKLQSGMNMFHKKSHERNLIEK